MKETANLEAKDKQWALKLESLQDVCRNNDNLPKVDQRKYYFLQSDVRCLLQS